MWGKVAEETEGPKNEAQMVTMTTLLGAPTKHHHPENQTKPEGGEGWEQNGRNIFTRTAM